MKPDLSHYYGRGVEGVEIIDPTDDPPNFAILLNGGVRIINHDSSLDVPDSETLGGKAFLLAIFSELDTRLVFGRPVPENPPPQYEQPTTEITLTPIKYAISDPGFAGGKEHFPQREPGPEEEKPDKPDKPEKQEAAEEPESEPEREEGMGAVDVPDGEE